MKRIFFLSVLFSLATVFMISCSKDDDNVTPPDLNTPNATDNSFITTAAFANRNIVELSQLAATQSTNDSVKLFAQTLLTNHTAAISSLDSLAAKYNITVPTAADSTHLKLKDSFSLLTGYTFDTSFINLQVREHSQLVALYQDEISNGNADTIQNYATALLPTIQSNQQMADSISANLE